VLGADGLELTAEDRAARSAGTAPPVHLQRMLREQTGIRDVPSLTRTR